MDKLMLGDPRTDGSYNALQLDALSSANVSGPASAALNCSAPFTLDAWIRFNGLPAQGNALAQDDVFAFGSMGSSIFFELVGVTTVQSDLGLLSDDSWHHICATFDGAMLNLYVDGFFNSGQSIPAAGAISASPIAIGGGVQGLVRRVRLFNKTSSAETVVANMFADPASLAGQLAAYFDFSQVPPADIGPSAFAVSLLGDAAMIKVSPALSLGFQGFARPFGDHGINPGGQQIDPYSVQSWIYVDAGATGQQAIFVNSDLESDTGIALYLEYDSAASAYRLVSQRGSNSEGGQRLVSTGTIPTSSWVNVATTFDGLALSLYIQGALDGTPLQCPPIPLYSGRSDLLIGAAIAQGIPAPTTVLQGYIREVDVWSIALGATQIVQYMGELPDPLETGLEAAYNFTSSPARNQANGHPIGLAEGAVLSGQLGPPAPAERQPARSLEASEEEAALVAGFRASIDFSDFLETSRDSLAQAMQADIDAFTDEADRALIRDRWQDVIERMRTDPTSLPLFVTAHHVGGDTLLVCHRPTHSFIAYRAVGGLPDECFLWRIRLVFTLVAGALDAFTGIGSNLTDKAVSYIAGILAAPAVSAKLAQGAQMNATIILQILALLYEQGYLRPLIKLMIDVGFWTLIRVLARMVLVAAGVGAANVIASLVATAATFMGVYASRPLVCDPLPAVVLTSIAFNWDPTGVNADALAIRQNLVMPVSSPEWTPGSTVASQCPVAYALSQVQGVSVYATFTLSGPTPLPVSIQALGGGLLGPIAPRVVPFFGLTTGAILPLANNTLASAGVQTQDVQWQWQYRIGGGPWIPMVTTNHRVYVVLAPPSLPWVQSADVASTQRPWALILDRACVWAAGATTADLAAVAITRWVNEQIGLTYDVGGGRSVYTSANGTEFLATAFLAYLAGGGGNGATVNCTDCASIVATFVNAVGGNLTEAVMQSLPPPATTGPFPCNEIKAIGSQVWARPFDGNFAYHEVAWKGALGYDDWIFDACLQLDTGPDPWAIGGPHTAGLVTGIRFTTRAIPPVTPIATPFNDVSYRERLATNSAFGIGACIPQGPRPWASAGRRPVR
ncbi:MAG TPA: LamG domain-containing protein [Allosphingosinicella sp.]|jgi:hypothetical protein